MCAWTVGLGSIPTLHACLWVGCKVWTTFGTVLCSQAQVFKVANTIFLAYVWAIDCMWVRNTPCCQMIEVVFVLNNLNIVPPLDIASSCGQLRIIWRQETIKSQRNSLTAMQGRMSFLQQWWCRYNTSLFYDKNPRYRYLTGANRQCAPQDCSYR